MTITVVDIGAAGGLHPRWRGLPVLSVLVEPEPVAAAALRAGGTHVIERPLADRAGPVTLNVCRKRECSSLYAPNRAFVGRFPDAERWDVVSTMPLEASTLDAELAQLQLQPDVLKLDAQGAELRILRGGEEALKVAAVVEVEVEFAPIYMDAPLFAAVDEHMRAAGFLLSDLRRYYWRTPAGVQVLAFGDALYMRDAAHPALAAYARRRPLPEFRGRRHLARLSSYLAAKFAPYGVYHCDGDF